MENPIESIVIKAAVEIVKWFGNEYQKHRETRSLYETQKDTD